jgi:acetyl-CoA/propionyl-CoA carboxylase biotin carboxyl carrier protein
MVPELTKVLIANRGEIAVRIARGCADAGLTSVAVYSPEDRDAMHVRESDEAYALGGATVAETYLNADAILAAARKSGADAVHPGYGFLAESAAFAQAVIDQGLTWIGPRPAALEELGNKITARALAKRVGAPLVPASDGPVDQAKDVEEFAREHGLPLVIKAAFGGGGRGMRVVRSLDEIPEAFDAAVREATAYFGRGECFVERYIERPRHVETQCLADAHGGVAVVSTRDCTIQRRHQKLIEEAPAPFLTSEQEDRLAAASAALLRGVHYQGAATCEFLLAPDGHFYFMEVNPRLQVEHPVTEEVTGLDLVREQFRIAAGEELGYERVTPRGHAVEFRINGEDPTGGFLPAPGTITSLRLPGGPGIRCDFGYQAGDQLTGSYDSLIGKVIVWGADRGHALARAHRAMRELGVKGVATIRDVHRAVIDAPEFGATSAEDFAVHTAWIEGEFAGTVASLPASKVSDADAAASAGPEPTARMVVEVDGKRLEVVLPTALTGGAAVIGGPAAPGGGTALVPRRTAKKQTGLAVGQASGGRVTAPMQGTVVRVNAQDGQHVAEGDVLVVLEAMKMEQPLTAPQAGTVQDLSAVVGERVPSGHVLCVVADA